MDKIEFYYYVPTAEYKNTKDLVSFCWSSCENIKEHTQVCIHSGYQYGMQFLEEKKMDLEYMFEHAIAPLFKKKNKLFKWKYVHYTYCDNPHFDIQLNNISGKVYISPKVDTAKKTIAEEREAMTKRLNGLVKMLNDMLEQEEIEAAEARIKEAHDACSVRFSYAACA